MNRPGWLVRPFRPGDEPGIVELWSKVFERRLTVEQWRWKHNRPIGPDAANTRPPKRVWLVESTSTGQIVGHYAGIPRLMRVGRLTTAAMVVVDAMVAPDFRHQGVFRGVSAAAHESWRGSGITHAIGLPNEKFQAAAPEWQRLFELRWWRRIVRPDELLARPGPLRKVRLMLVRPLRLAMDTRARGPARRAAAAVEAHPNGEQLADLALRSAPETATTLLRPPGWFDWRFGETPERRYVTAGLARAGALAAAAVWTVSDGPARRATIADVLFDHHGQEAAFEMLRHVVAQLAASGVGSASVLAVEGSTSERVLRGAGFRPRPVGFAVAAVALGGSIPIDALRSAQHWSLSGADFDVV